MKKTALLTLVCMSATLPALAQSKFDDRLGTSTEVLRQMLARTDGIPRDLLNEARCVMVYPNVKKVGIGLGVTYGRGVLTCRTGPHMQGEWSAPAMYTLDVGSLGVQLGTSSTDFVLLIMSLALMQRPSRVHRGPGQSDTTTLTRISLPTPGQKAACSLEPP